MNKIPTGERRNDGRGENGEDAGYGFKLALEGRSGPRVAIAVCYAAQRKQVTVSNAMSKTWSNR